MNPFSVPPIHKVLEIANTIEPREAKIEVLRKAKSPALLTVLQGAVDKRIKLDLPRGDIEFTPMPAGEGDGALYREYRMLAYCADLNLPFSKRLQIFIGVLEQVCRNDANLLLAMKDKWLPYSTITPDLVIEAFPELKIQPVDSWVKPAAVETSVPTFQPAPVQDSNPEGTGKESAVDASGQANATEAKAEAKVAKAKTKAKATTGRKKKAASA